MTGVGTYSIARRIFLYQPSTSFAAMRRAKKQHVLMRERYLAKILARGKPCAC